MHPAYATDLWTNLYAAGTLFTSDRYVESDVFSVGDAPADQKDQATELCRP